LNFITKINLKKLILSTELFLNGGEMDKNSNYKNTYVSEEQLLRILISLKKNYNHYLYVRVIYSLGLNLQEFINLKVKDVDLSKNIIKIRPITRLRNRDLSIPLNILQDIKREIHGKGPEEFLFQGRNGRIHPRTIQKVFEKIYKSQKIYINIAKLRKSLAIHLFQLGWDEKSIAGYLGHSSIYLARKMIGIRMSLLPKINPLDTLLAEVSNS
jgi:integrase